MPTIPNQQTNLRQRHTRLIAASIGVLLLLFVSLDSHVQSAIPMAVATIPSPIATVPTPVPTSGSTPFWTTWGARQYDLADDGGALWISTTGGVIRWEKSAQTHRRYTAVDGFPHQTVFAVAVDRAGNRWFGGDGGLSRLDANEQWQHFTTANSGLYTNTVDAIAVTSDGTLYAGHGLPNGGISRLNPTGVWQSYPNRTAAIESDYARILQTTNRNRLWTVAGAEIWLDYAVYDGVSLQDRTPAGATTPPLAMAVDSHQRVWTIKNSEEVGVWQNGTWSTSWVDLFNFGGYLSALTVDNQDNVWIGWVARGFAYSSYSAGISVLDEKYGPGSGVPDQVTHMLATAEGLWAIGPSWLRQPDGVVTSFQNSPLYPKVTDALVAADGTVWFSSGYHASGRAGAVQRYNDQQTLSLADDQWEILNGDASGWVDTFEEAPNGDVWYTTSCTTRMGWYGCLALIQYHAGQKYIYTVMDYPTDDHFSFGGVTDDLYFQDDRHLWLGMVQSGPEQAGVSHIDLGEDPLDPSDDTRTHYPIGSVRSIVLDAAGRLWVTNGSGLFRYDGSTWETIYQGEYIHDLVMATDGTLFARLGPTPQACQIFLCLAPVSSVVVLVVRPDGALERYDQIATMVANEATRVRSATRRNSLWVIGVDGAIWYRYADAGVHELRRYVDADNITSYPLPVAADAVQRVEIDHLNRVWLVANNQLWRFASAANVPVITATPTTTSTPTATPSPTSTPTHTSTSMPTAAPTGTPVGVPTLPFYFDVEVTVSVPKTEIMVGETITVLVTIENQSIGCQYPVYDLTLFQEDNQLFDYLSPMRVGPPVAAQTIYTLTATTPGTTHLRASAYGERNCYDYWAWQYINSSSTPLLVVGDSSTPTPTASPTAPNTVTPTLTGTATATATPTLLSTLSPTPTLTATASPIPLVATAQPGDGNGDQQINVDDLTACMQEIFDGDGLFWLDAPGGSYGGTSGCDANQDTRIDAGDLSCTVRFLFAGGDACTSSALVQRAETVQTRGDALAIARNLTATVGGQVQVPIHLTTTGSAVTAVAFSLHYEPDHFSFNSADENQNGLPDAVAFRQTTGVGHIQSIVTTAPSIINIALVAVADTPQSFVDGALVTVTFQVKQVAEVDGIISPVGFGASVPVSLGNMDGRSVPVTTQDGAVQIAPLLAPFRLYLPFMGK